MEDLPLGRIADLEPEFVAKDLPLGRTLMMMMNATYFTEFLEHLSLITNHSHTRHNNDFFSDIQVCKKLK